MRARSARSATMRSAASTSRVAPVAKVTMLSAGKSAAFESNINDFPHAAEPMFLIEAVNLKSLLDRTQTFIFKKDGQEHLKNILIRTTKGGYETLATNREVVARAHA